MAELNFNALVRPGPRGFMQGYEQGQQQRMVQETNQIAQDTSRFKLDELKQDREEMLQLQAQLKSLGQDPNPRTFLQTLKNTGRPEYVKMAIEGMQKLDDLDAYANLGKGGAMPIGAPAPAARLHKFSNGFHSCKTLPVLTHAWQSRSWTKPSFYKTNLSWRQGVVKTNRLTQ